MTNSSNTPSQNDPNAGHKGVFYTSFVLYQRGVFKLKEKDLFRANLTAKAQIVKMYWIRIPDRPYLNFEITVSMPSRGRHAEEYIARE
jgi:hypothetical protein